MKREEIPSDVFEPRNTNSQFEGQKLPIRISSLLANRRYTMKTMGQLVKKGSFSLVVVVCLFLASGLAAARTTCTDIPLQVVFAPGTYPLTPITGSPFSVGQVTRDVVVVKRN